MSPAPYGGCAAPFSAIGDVSQRSFGVGGACNGKFAAPLTCLAVIGYVFASLFGGCLHTVVSLRTTGCVSAAGGIRSDCWSAASFGSSTMIIPYRPLKTWFVEEWWCGWYQ